MAKAVYNDEKRAGEASVPARSLLRGKVAELSEAECGEVIEYIEVMRSLRGEATDSRLFGDGFARRVSAVCEGKRSALPGSAN